MGVAAETLVTVLPQADRIDKATVGAAVATRIAVESGLLVAVALVVIFVAVEYAPLVVR